MDELRYTLVTDGSSDTALIPILNWVLIENGIRCPIQSRWADLAALRPQDRQRLPDKLRSSLIYYPCDLLFVHRDAEGATLDSRVQEINQAIAELPEDLQPVFVSVVPVRMQETWLLIDESAIKIAAGNRRYAGDLDIPTARQLESISDPKELLYRLLIQASDLNRRRRRSFPAAKHARLVTEFVDDFSPLRQLNAFAVFEEEVNRVIRANSWAI